MATIDLGLVRGKDGLNVKELRLKESTDTQNVYEVVLSDDSVAGQVTVPAGKQGPQGIQGVKGETGARGANGADGAQGVGISKIAFKNENLDGSFIYAVTLTNNQTYEITCPIGPKGDRGDTGSAGAKGEAGAQGVGISRIAYKNTNQDGSYVYTVSLTNGTSHEITCPIGPKGSTGGAGPQGPKGDAGVQGVQGVGITNVRYKQTSSNGSYIYTIVLSNGNTYDITCPIGPKGDKGDDGDTSSITLTWSAIQNKPTTFPSTWSEITGKPSSFPPSAHNQDWGTITGIPGTFTPSPHKHSKIDITDFPEIPKPISALPIGTIIPYVGGSIPLGFLLCDGREIKQFDYPLLYNLLPTGWSINEAGFRRMAKMENPAMQSASQNGFTVTESSKWQDSEAGWKIFNRKYFDYFSTADGNASGYVEISYPEKRAVSKIIFKARDREANSKWKRVAFYGDDKKLWEESFVSTSPQTNKVFERELPFNETIEEYNRFKIEIEGENTEVISLSELEIYTVNLKDIPISSNLQTKKYLPDLRGKFLKGNTSDRKLLSFEYQGVGKHKHKEILNGWENIDSLNAEFIDLKPLVTGLTSEKDENVGYGDNATVLRTGDELATGDENVPNNISVNYIIKALNVDDEVPPSSVLTEINNKIENNKTDIEELRENINVLDGNTNYETVELFSSQVAIPDKITLNESIKNFRQIEIWTCFNERNYKVSHLLNTDTITYSDSETSATQNSMNRYFFETFGNRYTFAIFKTNGTDVLVANYETACITKIIGIGRK